jgi:hypothetical protein
VLTATFYCEPSLLLVLTNGAEPKKKRGRSAKPCLVVQFHPAPPLLRDLTKTAAAKAMMAIGPTRFTYYKKDGFEVWGKQYQDSAGDVTWRLRVFSEQDRRIETYEDVTAEPPEGRRTGESKAMRDAIAEWLGPVPAPGKDEQDANPDAPVVPESKTVVETAPLPEDELSLNEEERKSLSPRARAYIQYLEQEVSRKGR